MVSSVAIIDNGALPPISVSISGPCFVISLTVPAEPYADGQPHLSPDNLND